jgi:hypothetical protein
MLAGGGTASVNNAVVTVMTVTKPQTVPLVAVG